MMDNNLVDKNDYACIFLFHFMFAYAFWKYSVDKETTFIPTTIGCTTLLLLTKT